MKTIVNCLIATAVFGVGTSACSSQSISQDGNAKVDKSQAHSGDYQKPGAAIRFQMEPIGPLVPGEIQTVKVTVYNEYDRGSVAVKVGEAQGLRVLSDIREHAFALAGKSSHEFEVQVAFDQNGIFSLPLMATVNKGDGQTILRAGGLPFRVGTQFDGKKVPAKETAEQKTSGGIVAMDAEETIRPAE